MLWLPIQMYCIQWKISDTEHFNACCGQSIRNTLISQSQMERQYNSTLSGVCLKRIAPSKRELQLKVNQFCDKYGLKLVLNDW